MAGRGHDFVERTGIAAELNSAVGSVGTRNIQLVSGYAFAFVQDLNSALVILAGVAEDVGDDDDVLDLAQLGKFLVDESASPDVLQSDGIEHACGGLVKARRRVPGHGLFRQAFDDEAAQLVQVDDVFELDAVTKRAAGSDYGVLEFKASKADGEVRSAPDGGGGSGHRGCSVTRGAGDSKVFFMVAATCNANILDRVKVMVLEA